MKLIKCIFLYFILRLGYVLFSKMQRKMEKFSLGNKFTTVPANVDCLISNMGHQNTSFSEIASGTSLCRYLLSDKECRSFTNAYFY